MQSSAMTFSEVWRLFALFISVPEEPLPAQNVELNGCYIIVHYYFLYVRAWLLVFVTLVLLGRHWMKHWINMIYCDIMQLPQYQHVMHNIRLD